MTALEQVCASWGVTLDAQSPIEVPNVGREVELPALFAVLGFKHGAEIGVEQGKYSETLCKAIPGLWLHAVDSWTAHRGYRDHVSQDKLNAFHEAARKRLHPYGAEVIRGWSVDVAEQIENETLDFVYIDANHDFANVVKDIAAWSPKVRKGGIVAGHDFIRRNSDISHHVVQAVRGWTECYKIEPWFVLGRRERREGEVRDKNRSWMWVR